MHFAFKKRGFQAATAIAAATAVGLFGGVSPAFAEGAGVSTGNSDIGANGVVQAGVVPCIQNANGAHPSAHINLNNVGTVGAAQTAPSAAEYAGVWTAALTINGTFYFNPTGVFSDSACTMPALVPVTGASFSGSNTVNGVLETLSCSGVNQVASTNVSKYTRASNVYTITVNTTCTVTAGPLTATGPVTFVFTGNELPCLGNPPSPVDPCIDNVDGTLASTEFNGVYTES